MVTEQWYWDCVLEIIPVLEAFAIFLSPEYSLTEYSPNFKIRPRNLCFL